jgi:hypothetical protein
LIDRGASEERSLSFDQKVKMTSRSLNIEFPVARQVLPVGCGFIMEIAHERNAPESVKGLEFAIRSMSHLSTIIACLLVVDKARYWTEDTVIGSRYEDIIINK